MLEELILPLPHFDQATRSQVDLAALVEAHATTLFRVAYSLLRNRAEAEDTVQDTFVRVLEHRGTLPEIRDLRPWLVRITWNVALDRRRRHRPEQADELFLQSLVAPGIAADHALATAAESRRVLQALDRLPAAERQALLLSALDELPTVEVARILGRSESSIRSLIHRARTRLRDRLEKAGKR